MSSCKAAVPGLTNLPTSLPLLVLRHHCGTVRPWGTQFENHHSHPTHSFYGWENRPRVTHPKSRTGYVLVPVVMLPPKRELSQVGPSLSERQKVASRDKQDHCVIFLYKSLTDTWSCCPNMPKRSLFHPPPPLSAPLPLSPDSIDHSVG